MNASAEQSHNSIKVPKKLVPRRRAGVLHDRNEILRLIQAGVELRACALHMDRLPQHLASDHDVIGFNWNETEVIQGSEPSGTSLRAKLP